MMLQEVHEEMVHRAVQEMTVHVLHELTETLLLLLLLLLHKDLVTQNLLLLKKTAGVPYRNQKRTSVEVTSPQELLPHKRLP
jgi:carbonic anhydrase